MSMWKKRIEKKLYSEWVIRNALYWMTAYTQWNLEDSGSEWVISFNALSQEYEFEFERLLNDYTLRELLQRQTGQLRTSIIDNVLSSIDARLAE